MNCEQIKSILVRRFGDLTLDSTDEEHIQNCPDCLRYFEELKYLEKNLKGAVGEPLKAEEFIAVQDRLNERINHYLNRTVGFYRFMVRYGTSLAAVLLLLFVSFISGFRPMPYQYEENGLSYWEISFNSQAAGNGALSDEYYDLIFYDYVQRHGFSSSELLLGELYDEEYEYLSKNIKVGDML